MEDIIKEITKIGKWYGENGTKSVSDDHIEKLCTYMKKPYLKELHIQRVCAHTISNIAINQTNCPKLCEYYIHRKLIKSAKKHKYDWKMIWLSCSAIWNIARPQPQREVFDNDVIRFILQMMENFKDSKFVQETTMGSLSNLVLSREFVENITLKDMKLICQNLNKHRDNISVLTAGMGLLTNLAHDDNFAENLVNYTDCDIVELIIFIYDNYYDIHVLRNSTAALSNITNTNIFLYKLLLNNGIESIRKVFNIFNLENSSQNELALITQVINALNHNYDYNDIINNDLSSFHCMVISNYPKLVLNFLKNNPDFDINIVDKSDFTPLYYGLQNNNVSCELLETLVSYGSDLDNNHIKTILKTCDNLKIKIVEDAKNKLKRNKMKQMKTISESTKLIDDLSFLIVEYENPIIIMNNYNF